MPAETALTAFKQGSMLNIYGFRVVPDTLLPLFRLLRLEKMSGKEADETPSNLIASGLHLDSKTLLRAKDRMGEHCREKKNHGVFYR